MKLTGKIAILIGLTVSVSSCRKEELPSPQGCSSHQQDAATQRNSDSFGTHSDPSQFIIEGELGEVKKDTVEIVGGGDDDRDGGDIVGGGDDDRDGGDIVGGGDDDRDGGRRPPQGE